jgi:hypothetical protein
VRGSYSFKIVSWLIKSESTLGPDRQISFLRKSLSYKITFRFTRSCAPITFRSTSSERAQTHELAMNLQHV